MFYMTKNIIGNEIAPNMSILKIQVHFWQHESKFAFPWQKRCMHDQSTTMTYALNMHAKHILLINSPTCVTLMMSQVKKLFCPGKANLLSCCQKCTCILKMEIFGQFHCLINSLSYKKLYHCVFPLKVYTKCLLQNNLNYLNSLLTQTI